MILSLAIGWALLPPAEPVRGRDYIPEQTVLPTVRLDERVAHVRGVRSFTYDGDSILEVRYVDRTYDLETVRGVWFALSPFESWRGPAHAFLSFELADGQFVAVSFEARKEPGEEYSPLRGLLRQYELMAVVGDEQDVIGLRTQVWKDPVYLYPTRATPAQARALLEAVLRRAEALRTRPEYYHTLRNNCATNLAGAINEVRAEPLGWNRSHVLPGYSDTWAAELGLLDVDADLEEVRERYRINDRAAAAYGRSDFSLAIRR